MSALADPVLTVGTGMDALSHWLGAYGAAGNPEPVTIDKAADMFTAACTGRIEDLHDT